jgi:hypothetical protein
MVTNLKPNINSGEVHPQLTNNRHPVDGVLVHCGEPDSQAFYNWYSIGDNAIMMSKNASPFN